MGLRDFLAGLFKGRAKPPEAAEALRALFRARYLSFRILLNANNAVLQAMAEMEKALRGNECFGMSFIRARCTSISVNVYKVVHNLNEIGSGRYNALYEAFEQIRGPIQVLVEQALPAARGPWILPLDAVTRDMVGQVGGNMARLGEVRNGVGLPTPEGFVISAAAYKHFLEFNDLQDEIDRRLRPLEPASLESLYRVSSDIQGLIVGAALPPALEEEILAAYDHLESQTRRGVNVSLRCSVVGEEGQACRFADSYRSKLNVSRKFLTHTYKEVVAGKYAAESLAYRLNMGLRDEDTAMCVGCLAMVEAVSSGVAHSRDPVKRSREGVVIKAVWGLAKSVVDGTVSPDLMVVTKTKPRRIIKREIKRKEEKFVCFPEEGMCRLVLVGEQRDAPAVAEEQVAALAELADTLEAHYGVPQDVEWAIESDGRIRVLQTGPLRMPEGPAEGKDVFSSGERPGEVVLEGGVTASFGVASGPAFLVKNDMDMLQFPEGAVLIAEHSLAKWAAVLGCAAAVVTDRGGVTGELATACRDFNVPALFDTQQGTRRLETGMMVTVDAGSRRIYSGSAGLSPAELSSGKARLMQGSPVYRTLEQVLEHISPLNLTDPERRNFQPEKCRTYHDIARFCHEKSVREMFNFGKNHHFPERASKQLVCDIPMRWWVIDLEDGFNEPVHGETVHLENICSIPMLALWEGITAVPWKPPPVDAKGFMSVMFRSTMDPSLVYTRRTRYAERNYFMISRRFCDMTTRFGYHFSTIQTLVHDRPEENYVSFSFKGGGADLDRRILRIRFIEEILKQFNFRIDSEQDFMRARLEGCDADALIERLKVLGYLSLHTRQLDMVMGNYAAVNYYINQHLDDIYSRVLKRG